MNWGLGMTSQYACPMIATTMCPSGQVHPLNVFGCAQTNCVPAPTPGATLLGACQETAQRLYTTDQINQSIQNLINNWPNDPGLPSCLNFLLHYETTDGGKPTLPAGYQISSDSHPLTTALMIGGVILVLFLVMK